MPLIKTIRLCLRVHRPENPTRVPHRVRTGRIPTPVYQSADRFGKRFRPPLPTGKLFINLRLHGDCFCTHAYKISYKMTFFKLKRTKRDSRAERHHPRDRNRARNPNRRPDLNLTAEMWQTHRKFKSASEKNSSHLPRSATPLGSVYGGRATGTGAMPRPDGLDPDGVEPTARIPTGCNPLARGEPPGINPLANPHPNGMPLFPLLENPHLTPRST